MRRADRLFEIVQSLRGDRLVTAQALADKLEVSVRTIYRDVRDLQTAGVPIDGEAGVGYLLRPGFQLPPLMFTLAEIEALIVGARMVEAWAGRALAGVGRRGAGQDRRGGAAGAHAARRARARSSRRASGSTRRARHSSTFSPGHRRAAEDALRLSRRGRRRTERPSGRWRCISGAASGRSRPGASSAAISAPSASTAPRRWC